MLNIIIQELLRFTYIKQESQVDLDMSPMWVIYKRWLPQWAAKWVLHWSITFEPIIQFLTKIPVIFRKNIFLSH